MGNTGLGYSRSNPKPLPIDDLYAWMPRFMASFEMAPESSCWTWRGTINPTSGYGVFQFGGEYFMAHRLVVGVYLGDIPDGLEPDHLCRNRRCVNPHHLQLVTYSENFVRGLPYRKRAHPPDACAHGHALTPENTYVAPRGTRDCRACGRDRSARYHAKQRAA